ncbi:MAG TPA: amidohydrolase [Acidimicrobiia bacterium]|nr:amidohydrolase [Acidimicrobiia bacterium]
MTTGTVAESSEVTLISGGPIRTMDGPTTGPSAGSGSVTDTVEVVVVRGAAIEAVGPRALSRHYPGAPVVDLGGRTLVPGFIDAHNHLSIAALHPRFGDATDVTDHETLVQAVRRQAAAEPEAGWVRLHGWNDAPTGFSPTRADLDAAEADRPVVLAHSSLHQCVASSAALDALGIGRGTADPQGGEIRHGADGSPTGLLVERAWSEAHARSLAAYGDPDQWADHIATRARLLAREGIVAVHDAACSPGAEAVYRTMAGADALPISVLAMPHAATLLHNDIGDRLDGPRTGEGDHRLRVGPVKLFADGGIAIALDVSMGGHRIRHGYVMEDLEAGALTAARAGYRIAIHAIGNVGIDHAIDAFAAVRSALGDDDHRFRLEHAGVSGPAAWHALAGLDAVGVVQPGFVEHVGIQSQGVSFDNHDWLAFAGLRDAGVTLAGSSDDPCAPFAPLWCAERGARRTTSTALAFEPDQAVPLDEWLVAYTAGAAFAGGQERERGRIAPGLRADFVVLDGIGTTPRVAETWIAGRLAATGIDAPAR